MELIEFLFLGIGTYFDIKNKELPVMFFVCFGIAAMIWTGMFHTENIGNALLGASVGGFFLIIGWVTKESIGYGDGMGLAILGMFEGWQGMIPLVTGAFLLSSVYGIWRLLGCGDSRFEEIPFYPFLLIAFMGVEIL